MASKTLRLDFPNARGESLAARLELPNGTPRAFALFAHCFTCSKDVAAASRISRGLRERELAVLRFDFTGLGNSDGDFANTDFSSNVADLVAAADFLRERYVAPSLLVGHSLGGAAVLVAAPRIPESKAVATIGAPSSPSHVRSLLAGDVGRIEAEGAADVVLAGRTFSISKQFLDDLGRQELPVALVGLRRALLVLHAPLDEVVGIDHARRLYEAARHPKSFVALDGADHMLSRREDSEYAAIVLAAWAERYLPAAPDAPLPDGVVEVAERGDGKFTQTVRAGRHVLAADEPAAVGGNDLGPTPYDLLLAGLGTCTTMTLRMYADHKQWPLDHVSVRLTQAKIHAQDCAECEAASGKVDRIERVLTLTGDLTPEQRARLLEIADRCPVHRTLEGEKQIVTTVSE